MMILAPLIASMTLAAATDSVLTTFLLPDSIEQAAGVRVTPYLPESSTPLIGTDEDPPGLWYFPVASEDQGKVTRIWYQRVDGKQNWNGPRDVFMNQRTLCLGYLEDGKWSIPSLHPDPPSWGGPNNVVLRRAPYRPTWGGFNVFQLLKVGDMYRLLYWDQTEKGTPGALLAESDDGVNWTKDPRGTVFTERNDAFTLLSRDGRYIVYQTRLDDWPDKLHPDNIPGKRRVQTIRYSDDLVHWTDQETLLVPDADDAEDTEFYYLKVFPVHGAFAGLLMKYFSDPERPHEHSSLTAIELIVSRDAVNWDRPYRDVDLRFWACADPFLDDGKFCFSGLYYGDKPRESLVCYQPERLTGVVAEAQGSFVTPPLHFSPRGLLVNADVSKGQLEMELLDREGKSLTGRPACRIKGNNGTGIPVNWTTSETLPGGRDEYRLRVELESGALFSLSETP